MRKASNCWRFYRQVTLELTGLIRLGRWEAVELVTAGMAFDARLALIPYLWKKREYVVFHNPRKSWISGGLLRPNRLQGGARRVRLRWLA